MLSFNANAIKVGVMYKWCKPYQNNGFQIEELSSKQRVNALGCIMFFRGIINSGWKTCSYLKRLYKKNIKIDPKALDEMRVYLANGREIPIETAIASFNKYAEEYPNDWTKMSVVTSASLYLVKISPCTLD